MTFQEAYEFARMEKANLRAHAKFLQVKFWLNSPYETKLLKSIRILLGWANPDF